ncbi:MAG TPA: hypothetical protein VKS79_07695 [Gemmataceae bacterium]|nr:hypothetical protein [Gemmataceae bacterium]
MKRMFALAAVGLLFVPVQFSRADDDVATIVDKAIKAHGLEGKQKTAGIRGRNKGMVHIGGMDLEFTQEATAALKGKFKELLELEVMGQKVTITTVFNGKEGWLKVNDMAIPVTEEILSELKEQAHAMQLSQGFMLKDKSLKLSLIGETKVNEKPAIGVKVEKEGKKPIDFYFDKATGLVAKTQRRVRDMQTGQEANEERIITEYQDVDGRKIAKKVEVKRDGKPYVEVEVKEIKLLDQIDDSEFAEPK